VFIFGGAIAGSTGKYVEFALPGIIVQTIMFTSLTIGVNLNTDIQKGVFDRFRSLPIARSAPLFGAVLGDIVRHSIAIGVTLIFGTIIGFEFHTPWYDVLLAIVMIIAFAVSLCWVSVLIGMLARSSGAVQGISFLIVFPLTFGSSTFVAASTLPSWLQGWVSINPVTHVIESTPDWNLRTRCWRDAGRATALGSRLVRRSGRGLLPARHLGVPQENLAKAGYGSRSSFSDSIAIGRSGTRVPGRSIPAFSAASAMAMISGSVAS
jgi:ABC-2 type transporter